MPTSRAGNPLRLIVLAVLCGLVLGVGLALLREQADRRLHRAEDVSAAFDARVLTTVPRHRSLKRRVPFDDLPPDVAEAFRMLFTNLRYAPGGRRARSSSRPPTARTGRRRSPGTWPPPRPPAASAWRSSRPTCGARGSRSAMA